MLALEKILFLLYATGGHLTALLVANLKQHDDTMKRKANEEIVIESGKVKLCQSDIDRFWKRVNKNGPIPDQSVPYYLGLDQCWIWNGVPHGSGYSLFQANHKQVGAHIVSWVIHNGPIPIGMHVLHKCDVRTCTNISHLFLGTNKDNMDDKKRKGRNAGGERFSDILRRTKKEKPWTVCRGVRQRCSKLNDDKVREMRRLRDVDRLSLKQLSEMYGVSIGIVWSTCTRKLWKHVA